MAEKDTLKETFDEAIKVEKEMSSLSTNPKSREKKGNRPLKKNKEIKLNNKGKEKESSEIESFQRMVKELTNIVIDFKRNNGESSRKPIKP